MSKRRKKYRPSLPQSLTRLPAGLQSDAGDIDAALMREACDPIKHLQIARPVFFVYIDGYNFYAAINHFEPPDLLRLGWCNFKKLGQELVRLAFGEGFANGGRIQVKYFTSLVPRARDGQITNEGRRQQLWLDCLKEETSIEPILGEHRFRPSKQGREEKKTDVNISLEMFSDVSERKPTGLILVSGDLDFQPAVIHAAKKGIPVAVFCPLGHEIYEVKAPSGEDWDLRVRTTHLTREVLRKCRLSSEHSDGKWPTYLRMKIESQPEFAACLKAETHYAPSNQGAKANQT